MKLRTLGTGSALCRHPLIPACFAVETAESFSLIGAPAQAPARLEALGRSLDTVDMIAILDQSSAQTAGLEELYHYFKDREDKPFLLAPQKLLTAVGNRYMMQGVNLADGFKIRAVVKAGIHDQHHTEELVWVPHPVGHGYAIRLSASGVFITGDCALNEDWLFKEMTSEIILSQCKTTDQPGEAPTIDDLSTLPVYLQNKIWLYGYHNNYQQSVDPIPMLFVPPNAVVFDSERRDKWLLKERYIRENSKRILNNA